MATFSRSLLLTLAIATAYFLGGVVARLFALPPTMVMPIWPPSGIALVAAAVWGRHSWPGIVLGSMAFNALIYAPDNNLNAWVVGLLVGIGAAVQALCAVWLLRRFSAFPHAGDNAGNLIRQVILAGPLSCLINATWGSLTVVLLKIVPPSEWLTAFSTWWIGDIIGVVALLPFAQLWGDAAARPYWRHRLWISATVLASATLVVIAFMYIRDQETAQAQAKSDIIRANLSARLEKDFQAMNERLQVVGAFFNSSTFVDADEFKNFTRQLRQKNNAIMAIEWAPRLHHAERAHFEQQQQLRFPGFEVHEIRSNALVRAEVRDVYYPIVYVEPMVGHSAIIGLDIYSQQRRQQMVKQAGERFRIEYSPPINLIQTRESENALIAMLPFYSDHDSQREKARIDEPTGLLQLIIDPKKLLENAVKKETPNNYYTGLWTHNNDEKLIAIASFPTVTTMDDINHPYSSHHLREQHHFTHGGRDYILTTDEAVATLDNRIGSLLVLIFGLVLSAFIGTYLQLLQSAYALVEGKVEQRTKELANAKAAAEAANISKNQFLANMSHEIRTPMTAILGYTELLLSDQNQPPQRRDYLRTIRDSGNHLLGIINDLLDISKIEAEQLTLKPKPCSMVEMIYECERLLRTKADIKHLDLQFKVHYPVPSLVLADGVRVRQVVVNLLSNAIKFTDVGNVDVTLSYEPLDNHQLRWKVHVRDTGPGLSTTEMQRLFQPFSQVDESHKRRHGGTGLGLYISRKLAYLMQGDIEAVSELGRGSTFTFHFVTAICRETQLMYDSHTSAPEPVAKRQQFLGHALLAEDNRVNATIAIKLLQSFGVTVEHVSDGAQAVKRVNKTDAQLIDIIFMDMQMPGMDGYEAVTVLRAQQCAIPIVALTAHAQTGERERCLQLGCNDYTTKPFIADEIGAILRKHLAPRK